MAYSDILAIYKQKIATSGEDDMVSVSDNRMLCTRVRRWVRVSVSEETGKTGRHQTSKKPPSVFTNKSCGSLAQPRDNPDPKNWGRREFKI